MDVGLENRTAPVTGATWGIGFAVAAAGWPDGLRQKLIAITPQARFAGVDEVVGAFLFLASEQAKFITGQRSV